MPQLTLDDNLNEMNVDTLKILARKLDTAKTVTRKADIISAIENELKHHLADVVGLCSKRERLCLSEAVYNEGKVLQSQFYGKYGDVCPSPVAYYHTYRRPDMREVSPFPILAYGDDESPAVCVLKELVPGLRRVLKKPEGFTCKTIAQVPTALDDGKDEPGRAILFHSGEAMVFDELAQMLGLVQAAKIRVTEKTKRPTEATVRLVGDALIEPDFQLGDDETESWETPPGAVRAHAWPVLLQQCGWGKAKGSTLELTRLGKVLLRDLDAAHIKQGLTRFAGDDVFDELNRVNTIKGQTGKGKRDLTKPSSRRIPLYDGMRQWPVNEWIAFDDAYRAVLADGQCFSVCRREPWNLYFGDPQYGGLANEGVGDSLERLYLRALLMEPLATLGLVDIAYTSPHHQWPEFRDRWGSYDMNFCSRYDGLMYVRLNDLGAYCLGITETYRAKHPETSVLFKILPTLELALLQHRKLSALDRVRLEQFAVPKSDYVWALDRKHLLERLEAGMTVRQVREFLSGYGENEIPATVEAFLSDLDRRAGAVKTCHEAILIEIRDKETAALIAHDRVAGKYCQLSGSKHLAVPKQHEKPFRKALKAMGYILPQ